MGNTPYSQIGALGAYLYQDIYYRQWIVEVALAFLEGRHDNFIWLDLVTQFRHPNKQQIIPSNLTKEIIDEVSILYKETPIYQVVDEKGKVLKEDQALWEEIMEHSRYSMLLDKLDRWTRLLGTVLVKVSFVDPKSGQLVTENEGGQVQLDLLHGGVYDLKHGASPYYLTELMIGFGTKFGGFQETLAGTPLGLSKALSSAASSSQLGSKYNEVADIRRLGKINRIMWAPDSHLQIDEDNNAVKVKNPYGVIPAVPFFNQDPAHYYFLPVNEPLIYANHAINMRLTDLNHIAKFQSFGVPVLTGVERPTSVRQGRPTDDYNVLKGGNAQSRFGGFSGLGGAGFGGHFRSFDVGLHSHSEGNADANALGYTLGPMLVSLGPAIAI